MRLHLRHLRHLDRQVIVITGASSGIGLVTARQAAERGAKVVLAARNDAALATLAAELEARGTEALAVRCDVGRRGDVAHLAQAALERFGRFDTWVNNAGVSIFGHLVDVSIEDMHRVMDTVHWGVVYGSLEAVRHYDATRTEDDAGAIVNLGSFFGDRAVPIQSAYTAAKHAMYAFTEGLRMELESDRKPVSVTLVHPGASTRPTTTMPRATSRTSPRTAASSTRRMRWPTRSSMPPRTRRATCSSAARRVSSR